MRLSSKTTAAPSVPAADGRCGNYFSTPVTKPHIVVVLVPIIRTTAFACRYKTKLCVMTSNPFLPILLRTHSVIAVPLRQTIVVSGVN